MKKFDIYSKDIHLVERRKIWFFVPLVVLVISIIFGTIYGIVFNGKVLNLGMDFTGGYTITVKLGNDLTDSTYRAEKEELITDIIENPSNYINEESTRKIEGLKVQDIAIQGKASDMALRVEFTAENYSYQIMMGDAEVDGIMTVLNDLLVQEIFQDDYYSGNVGSGDSVSATVSSELLMTAICAVIMSIALMLIYIAVRFELLSGVIAIICLAHDIAIMFLFMLIFHIEIASTFVAALITILGYSINNTIIIFDKVRDIVKTAKAGTTATTIANGAVRETLVRSINTTATTLLTVLMVALFSAIFGVSDLISFCLPLIAGLIAGTFSSLVLAPSLWSMWKDRQGKTVGAHTLPPLAQPVVATVDGDAGIINNNADSETDVESNATASEEQPKVDDPFITVSSSSTADTNEKSTTESPNIDSSDNDGENN